MIKWSKKIQEISEEREDLVVDINDFEFGEVIGHGGYGDVIRATQKSTGKDCAVKKIYSQKLEGNKFRRYLNEIKILSTVDNLFLLELN